MTVTLDKPFRVSDELNIFNVDGSPSFYCYGVEVTFDVQDMS